MLFNSISFAVFLPVVFTLYWLLKRRGPRTQNLLIILASYVFYGWWDYRFLSLIVISSAVDYLAGGRISPETRPRWRKCWLAVSLAVNLGVLGFFKYFDFFAQSAQELMMSLGLNPDFPTLRIILPVGISFYTFQTLSYTIDIYRKKTPAIRDPVAFFAFVAFFPQLVAGPIERAKSLLPQFLRARNFDGVAARDGCKQILWGLFKKVVIADRLAGVADPVFADYAAYSGADQGIAIFAFAIQIYCDFSGYSDIAIGTARLFGINLMQNFSFPYFSRDIAEFWRRWHISLSTWFRDYVYVPLGGNRKGLAVRARNVMITFLVSGLWHGANWTFVAWGLIHGLLFLPLMLKGSHKAHQGVVAQGRLLPSVREFLQMAVTFGLTSLAWVFFRSESIVGAFGFLDHMASSEWTTLYLTKGAFANALLAVGLLAAEWTGRHRRHALEALEFPVAGRWAVYLGVSLAIGVLGKFGEAEFIYFQF